MVQIVLILLGLFISIKGRLKVSDSKEIVRPQSIFWGLIIILYGLAVSFIPDDHLIYSLVFYISLVVISFIFIAKGRKIESTEATSKSKDTKRNLVILLIFIAIIAAIAYFVLK